MMPAPLASWSPPLTPADIAARAFWSDSHPVNLAYRRKHPGASFKPSDLAAFLVGAGATLAFIDITSGRGHRPTSPLLPAKADAAFPHGAASAGR